MNILLITEMFPPHAGGSRVYYYNLLKNLLADYPDKAVVLTKRVPGWKEFDESESTRNLRIIRKGKPLQTTKYHELPKIVPPLIDTIRLMHSEKIDILQAGDLYPAGVIAFLRKKTFGTPYLAYCHGEISQTDRYRYQPAVRNCIYREADVVVANSEYTRRSLLDIGVMETRIHKITPGVDWNRFAQRPVDDELIRRFGLQGKIVLLTVGRLVERKNHEAVIRSVARISQEFPALRYLIAGEGPEQERLRRLTQELDIGNVVTFAGRVPDNQLPDFYKLCDVFVLPNCEDAGGDVEGFGMVFLEANAAGKPVVGGRSGGTADAVLDGVTGFLVKPENLDELTASLKLLVANPELRYRFGAAGSQRARVDFSWKHRGQMLREATNGIVERVRRQVHKQVATHSAGN